MAATETKPKGTLRVLMLDTEGVCFDLETRINQTGRHWDILRADSLNSMFCHMDESRYHVVAVVSSLNSWHDQDCLIKARALQPGAVRIQLPGIPMSGQEQDRFQDLVHRVFPEQSSPEVVAETTEYLVRVNRLVHKRDTSEYLSSDEQLMSPPAVYQQLNEVLSSDRSSAEQISRVIGQDPALAATVLKMANSAGYGMQYRISNIREAVSLLGVRLLRALALSGHLTRLFPQTRSWSSFSFERMNRRSMLVARLALQMCRDQDASKLVQDQAFVAGLLHDIGHLILAVRDPVRYREVMEYAADYQIGVCRAEKELLGLYHGEAAACVLSRWNLPAPVVEAVLLHHTPHLSIDTGFSPLTAVHIADAMLPSADNLMGADMKNRLSGSYLQKIGIVDELGRWKELVKEYRQISQTAH